MSLSKEQLSDLEQISKRLKQIERFAVENNIDLDVFMSQYSEEGYAVYQTEKIVLQKAKADKRKNVFEKAEEKKAVRVSSKS